MDLAIDGGRLTGLPSTVVDLTGGLILSVDLIPVGAQGDLSTFFYFAP